MLVRYPLHSGYARIQTAGRSWALRGFRITSTGTTRTIARNVTTLVHMHSAQMPAARRCCRENVAMVGSSTTKQSGAQNATTPSSKSEA